MESRTRARFQGVSGRRTIICAIVGRLSSCAPIHRRSVSALVSSKRPVETGQQDKSCPTIAQIIVPRPLTLRENVALEVNMQVFNLLNRPQWGNANMNISASDYGKIVQSGPGRPVDPPGGIDFTGDFATEFGW